VTLVKQLELFTDAVCGVMIGAPFGLIYTVIGDVIGNQIAETAEADQYSIQ
jgi:hypothetical protein